MKDQFYIVRPSNSSRKYFTDNTTTHFTTLLPQQIRLEGAWSVALTEIQIPLTFQHVSSDRGERTVSLRLATYPSIETNEAGTEKISRTESMVQPGIYKDVQSVVQELNNLKSTKEHLEFTLERGGYVSIDRICSKSTCSHLSHEIELSNKLQKILGFEKLKSILITGQNSIVSDWPANLSNGLPSMLMIYTDICEPYVTGDVQSRLLRAVTLNVADYTYGGTRIKSFSPPMYLPLLFHSFQTIEIDIRDQRGQPIPFDYGTLTVTLHFKRVD